MKPASGRTKASTAHAPGNQRASRRAAKRNRFIVSRLLAYGSSGNICVGRSTNDKHKLPPAAQRFSLGEERVGFSDPTCRA